MLPLLLLEAAAALPLPMVVLCAVCWRRWGGAKVRAGERGGGRWRPSSRSKAGGTDRRHHRLSMHRSIHHSGLACVCAMGAFCLLPGGAHSTAQPQPRAVERRTSPNLVSARKKARARAREIEGGGEARQLPLLTPRLKSSAAKSLLAPQGPPDGARINQPQCSRTFPLHRKHKTAARAQDEAVVQGTSCGPCFLAHLACVCAVAAWIGRRADCLCPGGSGVRERAGIIGLIGSGAAGGS